MEPITLEPLGREFYPIVESSASAQLSLLQSLNQLEIRQKKELIEICCGCETKNRYEVTSGDLHLFNCKEENSCFTRQYCGPLRSFDMTIKTPNGQEIIHLERPWTCQSCACCPCCCLQSISVMSPPGQLLGEVKQTWSSCNTPKFKILNKSGDPVLRIRGPRGCCPSNCCSCFCCDVDFNVFDMDGTELGQISKKWSGFCKEGLSDADNFVIQFPSDLNVEFKALLLGACLLIDFMYFEQSPRKEKKKTDE